MHREVLTQRQRPLNHRTPAHNEIKNQILANTANNSCHAHAQSSFELVHIKSKTKVTEPDLI